MVLVTCPLNGSVVAKPLINLHLTPNGCGIFGCGKDNDDFFPVRKDERYPEDDFYYQDNSNRFNSDPYQTRRQQVKFQSDFKPSRPVSRPTYDERPYREDFDSYHRPSNRQRLIFVTNASTYLALRMRK